jgi:hypothetical protein
MTPLAIFGPELRTAFGSNFLTFKATSYYNRNKCAEYGYDSPGFVMYFDLFHGYLF